jgi:hypothetical protein
MESKSLVLFRERLEAARSAQFCIIPGEAALGGDHPPPVEFYASGLPGGLKS